MEMSWHITCNYEENAIEDEFFWIFKKKTANDALISKSTWAFVKNVTDISNF